MIGIRADESATWAYVNGVSNLLGNVFLSEGHWLLAFYYFKIAKNMPKIINGQPELTKSYVPLYWFGIAANALLPIV